MRTLSGRIRHLGEGEEGEGGEGRGGEEGGGGRGKEEGRESQEVEEEDEEEEGEQREGVRQVREVEGQVIPCWILTQREVSLHKSIVETGMIWCNTLYKHVHNPLAGWTTTPSHISVDSCSTAPGPLIPTCRDPLEMFSHFFDDEVLSLIVQETNLFAQQSLAAINSTAIWETNKEEILAYFGFMVVMGLNRLPEIRDYWARDEKLHNSFIASRITRNRFEEISRYLHFVDNDTLPLREEPGYHRLQKITPIINAMKERFVHVYNPHTQNSIDEAMIPFKGTVL